MQLSQKQLDTHLKQSLLPLYLISGNEPLLVQDARDAVVLSAKSRGFLSKEIHHMESGFNADTLFSSLHHHDLFSDKKIIDIRQVTHKFDTAFSAFIQSCFDNPSADHIVIISTEKLTPAQQKTNWFTSIKTNGAYLPIWPVSIDMLPQWIMHRAKKYDVQFSQDIAVLLANYCEGNILAAQQSLEKLQLLHSKTEITKERLMSVLSDHARFTIFDLANAMGARQPKKVIRILNQLRQTGEEPALLLWSICRQLRENTRLPTNKIARGLQSAAKIDGIIKGAVNGDAWQALLELSIELCAN